MPSSAACSKSADERAHERLHLDVRLDALLDELDTHEEERLRLHVLDDPEAALSLDERLGGAVGELEFLHDGCDAADLVQVGGARFLRLGHALCGERDEMVLAHRLFKRLDRPLAPYEERHDELGKDDQVPQRNQRQNVGNRWLCARLRHGARESFPFLHAIIVLARQRWSALRDPLRRHERRS